MYGPPPCGKRKMKLKRLVRANVYGLCWSAQAPGPTVEIVVSDDGAGIPATEFANLFEPFYRIDRSRSRKTGGYGLGLSICKRILELQGGSVAIQRNPTRGVSFIVILPTPHDSIRNSHAGEDIARV